MPDLHGWISQQIDAVEAAAAEDAPDPWAATALRRCAADRKILDRHNIDPAKAGWSEVTACKGCGVYGDCDWPETDNLNDCPELLDLAAGYGITDEELAQLDRPASPPRVTSTGTVIADSLRAIYAAAFDTQWPEVPTPTPLERALDILGPDLRDHPLYRPTT